MLQNFLPKKDCKAHVPPLPAQGEGIGGQSNFKSVGSTSPATGTLPYEEGLKGPCAPPPCTGCRALGGRANLKGPAGIYPAHGFEYYSPSRAHVGPINRRHRSAFRLMAASKGPQPFGRVFWSSVSLRCEPQLRHACLYPCRGVQDLHAGASLPICQLSP
jgi:hypothetical protein